MVTGKATCREISSISNTREFQVRRAKICYKDGKKTSRGGREEMFL